MPDLDDPPISAACVPGNPPRILAQPASPSSQTPRQPSEADFEAWYRHHHRFFKAYAETQCRSEQDAEDILQEVVVELWKKLTHLPTYSMVRDWIRWRAGTYYKRHKNTHAVSPSPFPDESNAEMWDRLCAVANGMGEGFWTQAEPVDTSDHELARAAVAGLTEAERYAVGLYFSETPAPSWAAIARAMGCSAHIARKHCTNALRHLNSILNR